MQINSVVGNPLFPWLITALALALLGWGLYFSKKLPQKPRTDEGGKLFEALLELQTAILFDNWGVIAEQEFCAWLQQLPKRPQPSVSQMEHAAIEQQARNIEHAMRRKQWAPGTFSEFLLRIEVMSAEEILAFLTKRR